jgi:hypothetical protein
VTVALHAAGRTVAEYVIAPDVEATLVPRPYLHPVRTLGGTVVTDVLPDDHRWHLGAGLAVPDVNGANLWGGRSYVHGRGYVWLEDHGRIEHAGWRSRTSDALDEELRWLGPHGTSLLAERRALHAAADGAGWRLTLATELTNGTETPIELRSPAVNGRGDGAWYGGFLWRLPAGAALPSGREDDLNGSCAPSVTVHGDGYALVFGGLHADDRWFVRIAEYPAVGVAWAFDKPLTIPPGETVRRRYEVQVFDA